MQRLGKRERQHLRSLRQATVVRRTVHENLSLDKPLGSDVRVSSDLERIHTFFAKTGYAGRSIRVVNNIKGSEPKHKNTKPHVSRMVETGEVGRSLTRKLHRKVISKFRFPL